MVYCNSSNVIIKYASCARDLKVGDELLLSDGTCAIIESIQIEKLATLGTTYNFEVADFHTYYVSQSNVLVHNLCGDGTGSVKEKSIYESRNAAYRAAKRDAGIPMGRQPDTVEMIRNLDTGKLGRKYTFNLQNKTITISEHIGGHPQYGITRSHFNVSASHHHYFY